MSNPIDDSAAWWVAFAVGVAMALLLLLWCVTRDAGPATVWQLIETMEDVAR